QHFPQTVAVKGVYRHLVARRICGVFHAGKILAGGGKVTEHYALEFFLEALQTPRSIHQNQSADQNASWANLWVRTTFVSGGLPAVRYLNFHPAELLLRDRGSVIVF